MQSYPMYHAVKCHELFLRFNFKKYGINKILCKKNKADDCEELCGKVFAYCIFLIILDMIVNNNTFLLPIGFGNESFFKIKTYGREEILKYPSRWAYLDPVGSNWTGYQFVFDYPLNFGRKEKILYIYGKLRNLFYQYVNNGRQYY